jgi:hypothetical protein
MPKLTHLAYIVTPVELKSGTKSIWRPIEAVWPHKKGGGFDLVIPAGISVTGRVVCLEPKAEKPDTE